jgi:uncharacterized protein YuzE
MRINYDTTAQALDIELQGAVAVARTIQIDEGTLVDVDDGGMVVAIEVIQPMRRWPLDEILNTFEIDEDSMTMLRALWNSPNAFPFGAPAVVEEAIAAG